MTDTFSLLFVAICSIVLLTYLVVVRKVHAFIAILVAAAFVGLGTGMQAADVLVNFLHNSSHLRRSNFSRGRDRVCRSRSR